MGTDLLSDEAFTKAMTDTGQSVTMAELVTKTADGGAAPTTEPSDGGSPAGATESAKPAPAAPASTVEPTKSPTEALIERVNGTLERLDTRIAAATPPAPAPTETPVEPEIPAHIKVFLEHDDPNVRSAGEAYLAEHRAAQAGYQELQNRLEAVEGLVTSEHRERIASVIAEHIEDVRDRCNPPLSDGEINNVGNYLANVPDEKTGEPLAKTLQFEQGVHLLYPGRITSTNGTPGTTTGSRPVVKVEEPATETATVLDRGGAAGVTPTVRTPQATGKGIEHALDVGARATGLLPK